MNKATCILLAGGKSSRMGQDKSFIAFQGKRLIEYNLELLRAMFNQVLISANHITYKSFKLPVIADEHKNIGPIGGIHACLKESLSQYNIVLSCDMPFINQNLIYGLLKYVDKGFDLIAYQYNNRIEPLLACYSKSLIPVIEENISNKDFKLQNLFKQSNVKLIPLQSELFTTNLNTISDIDNFQYQFKWKLPNIILVSGDGRNVGKTFFTCSVIKHYTKHFQVVGVKTSSHFHNTNKISQVVAKDHNFKIIKEAEISNKDSSLMLQAGAKDVFFIMADKDGLPIAFEKILPELKNKIVIVESNGLCDFIQPGLFFFIKNNKKTISKTKYLKYQPIIVNNNLNGFDFNIGNLDYNENHVLIKY